VRNLFGHSAIKQALKAVSDLEEEREQESVVEVKNMDEDEQVVVFRLGKEEFGVPIANVEEIVRVPEELTRVPKTPAFVEGVINLRGTVLPVLDLRLRMGMKQVDRSDRQRIMVFMIAKLRTGFIVDQVAEVLKIPKVSIEAAPTLSNEQGRLLSRMANLEKQKRIVQLLDPTHLVEGRELVELSAVTQEEVRA
jgi:purine-binding chemotaxis protein CheW